ncbi:hypothetical protein, partial [Desulfomicrobium macestii]|uniref:hypothetical protein n=1 Tax=Desulfomicrobium macestii TaxID=90731 RepID=UPI001CEF0D7B
EKQVQYTDIIDLFQVQNVSKLYIQCNFFTDLGIIAISILTFWIIKLRKLKIIQQYTAVYLIIMIWSQQTVLQFANPMFFYQGMVVIFSAVGALFLGSEVVKDSTKKVFRKKDYAMLPRLSKTHTARSK